MVNIIGAPTLDDALAALRRQVEIYEERGEKTLIFCEDRLTLLSERAVLESLGGTFLTEVTTFARFLSGSARVLSKQGSVMEIGALIADREDELVCFRKGSAQAVYETIAQLSASRVDEEMLRAGAEETEGLLKGKLHDLALLLGEYRAFLREKQLVDENGYLALLPEKLSSPELRATNMIFFGFPSFTRQAQEGVRSALENANSVTGIFVAGREEIYTNEGAGIFRRLCEETGDARASMVKNSLVGEALALHDGIFSPDRFSRGKETVRSIFKFTAQDGEAELETVAALIRKHVKEGARYRDVAVLVPDAESFLLVGKVFGAYRIPFFADKKRAFSEHPFCAFALSVLDAVADGVLPDEADAVASSVYFGNGDAYRNYLLKFGGYRGAVRREIKEGDAVKGYDREQLCACREKMLALLALFPKKGKGSAFAEGVRKLYGLVGGEEITQALAERFKGAEREFLKIDPLESVLAETETVAGGRTFTAREFSSILKSGLDALEISMIPQSADAVFVGDATESKFARVKILFATGLTDALPRVCADTAVISDGEIRRLSRLQVEIEPAIAQVNARAKESLALNLCSFTDALYLSYPLECKGEETERGEVIAYAERLFEMPKLPDLFPYDCCEREPALKKLLAQKNAAEEGGVIDKAAFASLRTALETKKEEGVSDLLSGREKGNVPEAKELYFAGGSVSPTLLEQYFTCPYAGFASRGLRLREREERTVLDTDAGTFVHAVLERVAGKLNELKDEEECRAFARDTGRELLASPRFAALSDTKAGEYTGERLVGEGTEVSAAMYRQLAQSAFRVRATEEQITMSGLSLFGKADRIDESGEYVRIIDYKTGRIDDSAVSYYTGRKLQLQLYLRAAAKGKRAAGAFYFPSADNFTKPDETKYRMLGFYNGEDEVLSLMDTALGEGEKSELFEGNRNGKFTDKGMSGEDFETFLDYALLVAQRAENEMKAGNVAPSPYDGACDFCRLKSLCAFDGNARKSAGVKCADVVNIVKREKGEEV